LKEAWTGDCVVGEQLVTYTVQWIGGRRRGFASFINTDQSRHAATALFQYCRLHARGADADLD